MAVSTAAASWPQLIPLARVGARLLRIGAPVPFNIRNERGELLLQRGRPVIDEAMLESLLRPGIGIAAEELRAAQGQAQASELGDEDFFERWEALQQRLAQVLSRPGVPGFLARLQECVATVESLGERNADRLIFAVMRHDHGHYGSYGSVHALHVAAVATLLARRQGWAAERRASLIGAALTMNLSIVELQGQMAARGGALNPAQRKAVDQHPRDSARLLREAGVDDREWLLAIEQHHEKPGGGGYPSGMDEPCEMAQLLHYVDVFMAKHSGRAGRAPLPAQQAARELYTASGGHPVAALLIKEFGVFPPGCFVRLVNGETAIVIRRGPHASQPLVCALMHKNGAPLATPQQRDTAQAQYAISATLSNEVLRVSVPAARLYRAAAS